MPPQLKHSSHFTTALASRLLPPAAATTPLHTPANVQRFSAQHLTCTRLLTRDNIAA
ncbi:hypothetical protein RB11862 [Rhodopirellula baltica SH 1]|uniref:Uncharacterized protein n=1 Tax=Rhodopirellula baltica (strain DSM 10527 / NCIMB 13988 / SH1) TaxID=243090 RepID=Q7UJJ1_RHOBA|nr:hypothetical protein RB11862 [Rhodopirellula baltica SH 1]